MQIRDMLPEDLDQVMEMESRQHKPWPRYGFGQAMRLGHYCPVVEDERGNILGYGVTDGGHGRNIYATSGRAALAIYKEWFSRAKELGAPVLWAETDKDNVAAIAMLVRFGFEKAGVRPSFYGAGIDAIVWTRANPTEALIGVQGRQPMQAIEPV